MEIKGGTWAEFIVLSTKSLIIPIPQHMTFEIAAAISVAANAALRAFGALRLNINDTIFLAGASGDIGTILIQLAKISGLNIYTNASSKNHPYMISLDANYCFDYHNDNWPNHLLKQLPSGVDAAIAIQPNTSNLSIEIVKDYGQIISISGDTMKTCRNILIIPLPYGDNSLSDLINFFKMVSDGLIKIVIEKTYEFKDAIKALEKVTSRRARGKSVIVLQ